MLRSCPTTLRVIAGLAVAIHALTSSTKDVDAGDQAGHDDGLVGRGRDRDQV